MRVPLQAAGLSISTVPGGYVVRRPGTRTVHHLNATAAMLLELCQGQMTEGEILEAVQRAYPFDAEASRAVVAGLEGLARRGLIVWKENTLAEHTGGAPRLSLLICGLRARRSSRERLMRLLTRQADADRVEILVEEDDGQMATGTKRNRLLERATGNYVAFIDDDDLVADNYIASVLAATTGDPDAVALEGRLIDGDAPPRRFLHSIACGFHREENGIYLRTPNHLNPIKRSLALAVRFADVWFGEDRDFARRIAPTLRTEARQLLGQPLYFYMNGARAKALAASTRLLFKFPTRGRPDLFRATMEKAVARLSRRQKVRFLVSIDDDDTTMKTPEVRRFLRRLRASVDVKVVSGTSSSKVEAVNRDLTGEDFDVLVVMSDDMEPVVDGYDEEIANDMARYFPGLDGAILYDDGFQKPGDRPMPIMTLPVLGRRLYDTLGYVYHPSYVSEWCDDEMTEVVRRRGALHHAGKLIIEHRWVGTHHADSLHRRNSAFHDRDRANYQQRRAAGFPA